MKGEQICRLCFNVTENAFEYDCVISEILDVLLLKINLDLNKHQVMCHNCFELVKKTFNFKAACIYAERSMLRRVVDNPEDRFQLNNVYKGSQIMETGVDKKIKTCRLCMKPLDEINLISLDLLMNNTAFAVLMPEIDLDIAKDPVTCFSCKENLEQYFMFVWQCLNAEEMRYRKIEGVKNIPNSASGRSTKQDNALEETWSIDSEIGDLLLLIKYIQEPVIRQKSDALDVPGSALIKTEDWEIKNESVCVNKKSSKRSFNTKKMVYECEHCGFKTNTKRTFKNHTRIHVEAPQIRTYTCLLCPYVAKYSSHLVTHMLIHKDVKEIQMHKCAICNYESKYKKGLKAHMLIHKNTIEVQMYKCLQCTYETKLKNNLKKHMLKHKDPSELEMCRCMICPFETKYKKSLKNHMLGHQRSLEGGIYKCTICIYKTNRESSFKSHLLTHESASQGDIHKCAMCGYQTKMKSGFKRHLLVHKELSQIETYKCFACSFETKLKDNLKKHMIVHKDSSEMEIYKCTSCTYETKYKRSIQRHLLVHKK